MTDGLTYRGQDSISTLYFIFFPFWRRLYCFHKVICQPLSRWEEAKLLKKGAKGGCFSEANDKMNQARWNNSCDMNNDAIMMLCRHCHGNKILSAHHTSCLFATGANLKGTSQYRFEISEPDRPTSPQKPNPLWSPQTKADGFSERTEVCFHFSNAYLIDFVWNLLFWTETLNRSNPLAGPGSHIKSTKNKVFLAGSKSISGSWLWEISLFYSTFVFSVRHKQGSQGRDFAALSKSVAKVHSRVGTFSEWIKRRIMALKVHLPGVWED